MGVHLLAALLLNCGRTSLHTSVLSRFRATLKCLARQMRLPLATFVVITLALLPLSSHWGFQVMYGKCLVQFRRGNLDIVWFSRFSACTAQVVRNDPTGVSLEGPWIHTSGASVSMRVPMPFLTAVALLVTLLCWRCRSTTSNGCCRCGYDLTGNSSGNCPECGRNTEVQETKSTRWGRGLSAKNLSLKSCGSWTEPDDVDG